jgi:hypothetical protein
VNYHYVILYFVLSLFCYKFGLNQTTGGSVCGALFFPHQRTDIFKILKQSVYVYTGGQSLLLERLKLNCES